MAVVCGRGRGVGHGVLQLAEGVGGAGRLARRAAARGRRRQRRLAVQAGALAPAELRPRLRARRHRHRQLHARAAQLGGAQLPLQLVLAHDELEPAERVARLRPSELVLAHLSLQPGGLDRAGPRRAVDQTVLARGAVAAAAAGGAGGVGGGAGAAQRVDGVVEVVEVAGAGEASAAARRGRARGGAARHAAGARRQRVVRHVLVHVRSLALVLADQVLAALRGLLPLTDRITLFVPVSILRLQNVVYQFAVAGAPGEEVRVPVNGFLFR